METVKIDDTGYYFVYNKTMVAVALLKGGKYLLYFNENGYDSEVLQLCLENLKQLNEEIK